MPIYDYKCEKCKQTLEYMLSIESHPGCCIHCGGKLKRQISSPNFHLKGKGFYETDYKKNDNI